MGGVPSMTWTSPASTYSAQTCGLPANASDSECCYLGILYFERGFGFEDDDRKIDYFRRAKHWLEKSKTLSGPAELPGALDTARVSLAEALHLGEELLEAYRAARSAPEPRA